MRIGGGGGVAAAHVALVAPEIPPLLMHRLPIPEHRSFSDSNSRLLFLIPFISSVSASNLAITLATAFNKNFVALASTRHAR